MTVDDILENLSFLDTWEDRYRLIIDLGRDLPPMDEALKTDGSKVQGCMSQVWLVGGSDGASPPRLHFVADSDALVVKGLIAVLLTIYQDRTPAEILATDIADLFGRLGFQQHISVNRRNGFYAMVERIKGVARELADA